MRFGTLTPNMAKFMEACVKGRMNVIISGGTGSGKTKLVINRGAKQFGVDIHDVEKTIDFLAAEEVPSEGNTVVNAANKGVPFVLSHPQTPVSKAVQRVARLIIDDLGYQNDLRQGKEKGNKSKKTGFINIFNR
ncbi:MAG: Flp pilus assembly complex ATPase component TadA, partial [Syntrophomonadaceae bacterium]|nr:Flp pilus assembly complex ATPase component TadA [Syntrophomonadaceae bacterium]